MAPVSRAQTTGDCDVGADPAFAELDVANVRARVYSNGALFGILPYRGLHAPVYEVPKGSGRNAIFTAHLRVGGIVRDELRVSAASYSEWEFWPGPLDDDGNPPEDCSAFDRIYNVYDEDIRRYNETGQATADMVDWPWQLGAPVFDGDGIPDNYDLAAGDRPYVFGDQTLWWVMNDAGNLHLHTESEPIGLEARVAAFAGWTPRGLWTANTTLYRYELIYRGRETLEDAYVGVYADPDLGYRNDDYIGSDTVAGVGFVYNGDDFDEGDGGYGYSLPALGFHFAKRPLVDDDGRDNDHDGLVDEPGEQLRMTSFGWATHWTEAVVLDGRYIAYDFMQGRFPFPCLPRTRDCSPWTPFTYPSMPPEWWSEENTDARGTRNVPGDRRLVMASGPFRMEPGDRQEIILAIIFSQGGDRFESVRQLKGAPWSLRNSLTELMAFDTTAIRHTVPEPEEPTPVTYALGHHPNPASEVVHFRFELPAPMRTRLVIHDVLGRELQVVASDFFDAGRVEVGFSTAGLPSGVYVYRLETPAFNAANALTVIR